MIEIKSIEKNLILVNCKTSVCHDGLLRVEINNDQQGKNSLLPATDHFAGNVWYPWRHFLFNDATLTKVPYELNGVFEYVP